MDWASQLIGHSIEGYELVSVINGGMFGTIYQAESKETGELVAIKAILPGQADSAQSLAEFEREGVLLGQLRKASNVVDLLALPSEYTFQVRLATSPESLPLTIPYHIMELAEACLERVVLTREEIPWVERIKLWRGVILGVHQMHLKNIAHRDLKSTNCLLFLCEKSSTITKVTDLGRSRQWTQPSMYTPESYASGRGDFRFAPPEYLLHQGTDTVEAHRSADFYGLGSVLFELATGVGITQDALGYGPDIVRREYLAAQDGSHTALSGLRSLYDSSYRLFLESLPLVIKERGKLLIETLCDPVPANRFPKTVIRGRNVKEPGLRWLLSQSDILIRMLEKPAITQRSYRKKKVEVP